MLNVQRGLALETVMYHTREVAYCRPYYSTLLLCACLLLHIPRETKQVLCGLCHPYSAQLYERLDAPDGLTMTNNFCDEFFSACSSDLDLPSDYCDIHTGGDTDQYWAYPLVLDGRLCVMRVYVCSVPTMFSGSVLTSILVVRLYTDKLGCFRCRPKP